MSTQILTPVGRLVQGHPMEEQTKDMDGDPLVDKHGKPRVQYFLALAVEKTNPEFNKFFTEVQKEAFAGFRNNEPSRPDFAWKVLDGDDPKHAGKAGFAGHFIIRLTSGFAPTCYTSGGASVITDEAHIKRGYYLRALVNINANGDSRKPGVYLNPVAVELVAFGEIINSGPDGAKVFGGAPVATLPAGASKTPPANPVFPGAQSVPAAPVFPGAANPVSPGAQPAAPVFPGAANPVFPGAQPAAPAPAYDFLNPIKPQ